MNAWSDSRLARTVCGRHPAARVAAARQARQSNRSRHNKRFLEELPAGEYPYLAEHIGVHLAPSTDDVNEFEFGLDLVLDGLERISRTARAYSGGTGLG